MINSLNNFRSTFNIALLLAPLKMRFPTSFVVFLLQISLALTATISRQIRLGLDDYFLPPTAAWKLDSWRDNNTRKEEFTPLTVIKLNSTVSSAAVSTVLERYAATDDVWTPSFAEGTHLAQSLF